MENQNEFKSVCEKVQFYICTEQELDEDCQKHLSECVKCRAYPEQINSMCGDLKKLQPPGIKSGDISNRVMKEISSSRAFTFPKVNVMRHIGTAAAIVIVIALFAANKAVFLNQNQSKPDTLTTPKDKTQSESIQNNDNVQFKTLSEESGSQDNTEAQSDANTNHVTGEQTNIESNSAHRANMELKAATFEAPAYNDTGVQDLSDKESTEQERYISNDTNVNFDKAQPNAVSDHILQESISEDDDGIQTEKAQGVLEDADSANPDSSAYLLSSDGGIFKSAQFDLSEQALQSNVDIANSIASEYSEELILNYNDLINNGVTNQIFLNWISSVITIEDYTQNSLISYSLAQ